MFCLELLHRPEGDASLLQSSLGLETTDLLCLSSCSQQGRHQLILCWVITKLLFQFSKKNYGTSVRAAKLHHFATFTAECTAERSCVASNCSLGTHVLVHSLDMGLWGLLHITESIPEQACELILMRRNILFLQLLQLEYRGNKQKYSSRK